MKAAVFALTPCLLTLGALAQNQGPTETQNHVDLNVPAKGGDEGQLRFGARLVGPAGAIPVRELDPHKNRPMPKGAKNRPVIYDVATGRETILEQPVRNLPPGLWIDGQVGDRVEPESLLETFSVDLTSRSSTAFPWSAQCRITFTKPSDGLTYVGSGTLIDARTVITAGHVIHEGTGGAWHTNIVVTPAFDGTDDAYGSAAKAAGGGNLLSWTGWTQNGNFDGDMGLIRLDRPVGFLTGWFGYGYRSDPTTFYETTTFNVAGYPGASSCYTGVPNQLYYGYGVYDTTNPKELEADCLWTCSSGGVSGAGTYWIDTSNGTSRYVHGVHSHRCYNCTPNTIGHTRITQSKFDTINQSFIPDGYSSTQIDLVPLDVNVEVGAAGIAAGSQLVDMDYLVGNMSLYDPASATYNVSVYLSDNDNISTSDTLIQQHSFTHDFSARGSKRVNVGSLPCIPVGTPPGDYWIGVIVDVVDADGSNDDTDGWDAAPITVIEMATLPSNFRVIGSGYQEGFERHAGVLPNHMAMTRRDPATGAFDVEAWANIGQLGTCLNPANGSYNLELGLDPASSNNHLTETGLVLGLDGTGSGPLVLDFSGINYGEEPHCIDGVWISSDGEDWQLVIGDWSTMPSTWDRIEGVDLSGTSVDTNGPFYLLFAQSDTNPFGGVDGVGIDDICVRPTDLTLNVRNLVAGSVARIGVTGSSPNGAAFVFLSVTGGGPIATPFGSIELSFPWFPLPPITLDHCGRGELLLPLPPGSAGRPLWFHGIDVPNLELTNPVAQVIQ